jgi:hypothetical protein
VSTQWHGISCRKRYNIVSDGVWVVNMKAAGAIAMASCSFEQQSHQHASRTIAERAAAGVVRYITNTAALWIAGCC